MPDTPISFDRSVIRDSRGGRTDNSVTSGLVLAAILAVLFLFGPRVFKDSADITTRQARIEAPGETKTDHLMSSLSGCLLLALPFPQPRLETRTFDHEAVSLLGRVAHGGKDRHPFKVRFAVLENDGTITIGVDRLIGQHFFEL